MGSPEEISKIFLDSKIPQKNQAYSLVFNLFELVPCVELTKVNATKLASGNLKVLKFEKKFY